MPCEPQVYLPTPAPGTYAIMVVATRLFALSLPCNFSVAVRGPPAGAS
jgi:hypothetical protein